jgi:uncharacterized protein YerC
MIIGSLHFQPTLFLSNTNPEECSQFYDDFCTAAVYGSVCPLDIYDC